MGLGGMFAKWMTPEQRAEYKAPNSGMALRVQHVGQYAPHDVAKKAGVQVGDVVISFDGRTDLLRETDLLEYALNHVRRGTAVPMIVLREGNKVTLSLPVGQ
jgi:S1-C subfamily serine protease